MTGGIAYPVGLIGSAVCIGVFLRLHVAAGAGRLFCAGMGGTGRVPVDQPPTWSALEAKAAPDNPPQ